MYLNIIINTSCVVGYILIVVIFVVFVLCYVFDSCVIGPLENEMMHLKEFIPKNNICCN